MWNFLISKKVLFFLFFDFLELLQFHQLVFSEFLEPISEDSSALFSWTPDHFFAHRRHADGSSETEKFVKDMNHYPNHTQIQKIIIHLHCTGTVLFQ